MRGSDCDTDWKTPNAGKQAIRFFKLQIKRAVPCSDAIFILNKPLVEY